MYVSIFFMVPNWPKIGIFLGLEFSSTFGPLPSHIFPGGPPLSNRHKDKFLNWTRDTESLAWDMAWWRRISLLLFLASWWMCESVRATNVLNISFLTLNIFLLNLRNVPRTRINLRSRWRKIYWSRATYL